MESVGLNEYVTAERWTQNTADLVLSYFYIVYYKQPIFGLTQEWFRELSFSGLECGVHDRLHSYPLCGIFRIDTAFSVSSERHRDSQSLM